MTTLFPEIEPFNHGYLQVSDIHNVYYEEVGNPEGLPIVFIHGGPGGGVTPEYRRFFNPEKWRVILFDQRGCGKSTPFAELKENTTWDLVEDIEKIKNHLDIKSWSVFGGSWGSTLALAYGQTYPKSCDSFLLRGIFLLREKELRWFYQEGASFIFPDEWEKYKNVIPTQERNDFISAYYKRLTGPDKNERMKAAKAWSQWEGSTSKLTQDPNTINSYGEDQFAEAFARIECHYFYNKGFFKDENQILNNIQLIKDIPAVIVQGRYDVVCPVETAWELHKKWPEADFHIISDAGHSAQEPGITSKLIEYTEKFAALLTN
ncbi:prolyl aminopeptidase [Bacteriovoracales bacterium]|nr:prolyl aminopeptidase [Bacteriovoracales bacterium]